MAQNRERQLRTLEAYAALTRWGSSIILSVLVADRLATIFDVLTHKPIDPVADTAGLLGFAVGSAALYNESRRAKQALAELPLQVQAEQQPARDLRANPLTADLNPPAKSLPEMLEKYPGTNHIPPQEQQPQE